MKQPPGELLEYVEAVRVTLPPQPSRVAFMVSRYAFAPIFVAPLLEDAAIIAKIRESMQRAIEREILEALNVPRNVLGDDNVSSFYARHHQAFKTEAPADQR